ncbi:MAG: type II secretion system protein GspG [Limisphaerales bacterium]
MNLKFITTGAALALLCLGCSTTKQQGVRSDDVMQALNRFEADCGRFPTTAEGLSALVEDPGVAGWKGPYWQGGFGDRWGTIWRYANEEWPTLYSPRGKLSVTQMRSY